MTIETLAELQCHKATPAENIRSLDAVVLRADPELTLHYRLVGDVLGLRLAPPRERHMVELWRHTCFELFIAIDNQSTYHEFNFAPWGEWCWYGFRGYRDLTAASWPNQLRSPAIVVSVTEEKLDLKATIFLRGLSPAHACFPLRLGVAAVIEPLEGPRSYWALHHPSDKPDFHHADGFALRLNAPGARL
jgi:hypothetical protein